MSSVTQEETSYQETMNENENEVVTPKYPVDPLELLGEKCFHQQARSDDGVGSTMQEFFRDTSVFITGGTGFLGKSLLEKLLRSCPHIKCIYLLIRSKKGKSPEERLKNMLQHRLFNRLKQEVGDFSHKISVMDGDLVQPGLGLSESDKKVFSQEVNVIYHNGATVRFNEKLKIAFTQNVVSTREVIKLARTVENLKAVIYVSTAYSFCIQPKIEEKVYDELINYEKILNCIMKLSDEELEEKEGEIIGRWPNSYTFSKALAECIVKNESHGLPIAIFRPSAVMSTYKEPVRGWTDSFNGPFGLIASAAHGITHAYFLDKNRFTFDMVPVDLVVNCLICITRETNERFLKSSKRDELVYLFCSGPYNQMTWRTFIKCFEEQVKIWPLNDAIWSFFFITTHNKYFYAILKFFLHTLPATICDQFLVLTGRKPMLKKYHYMIDVHTRKALDYFVENDWIFVNSNTHRAWQNLSSEDKSIFFFNVEEMSWDYYFETVLLGMRVYLMNDDVQSLPSARKKWKRFHYMNQALISLLTVFVMYFLWVVIHYFFALVGVFNYPKI